MTTLGTEASTNHAMPAYRLTAPNGAVYIVTAQEGTSLSAICASAEARHSQGPQAALPAGHSVEYHDQAPEQFIWTMRRNNARLAA